MIPGLFITFFGLLLGALAMASWVDAGFVAAALAGSAGLMGMPFRPFWRRLRSFLLFAAVIVVFGGLDPEADLFRAGPVGWSVAALDRSAQAGLRLVYLGAAAAWLDAAGGTARLLGLFAALAERTGRLGLALAPVVQASAVAIRFLPIVEREADRLQAAWKVRGALLFGRGPVGRARYAMGLAVPLLAAAMRRAERLAEAVEARTPRDRRGRAAFADGPAASGERKKDKAWTGRDVLRVALAALPLAWKVWSHMG